MRVEWDEAKNLENRRKHDLSFEEARELFTSGVDYLEIFDEAHSDLEDRFIAIGPIARCATEREKNLYRSSREGQR